MSQCLEAARSSLYSEFQIVDVKFAICVLQSRRVCALSLQGSLLGLSNWTLGLLRVSRWVAVPGILGFRLAGPQKKKFLSFRSRSEGFRPERVVPGLEEGTQTALFPRFFQVPVELFPLGQACHGGKLGVQDPGLLEPHHFQP